MPRRLGSISLTKVTWFRKTASAWVEILDELLDAYQRIFENLPIFEVYQTLFQTEPQMQSVLESVWSDILEFHSKALRIFSHSSELNA